MIDAEHGELLHDLAKYRRLVGKLNYLTVTRPDISFAVSVVSQFMSSPRTTHWDAMLRIIKYLKEALGKGLIFKNYGHLNITGFSDADWLDVLLVEDLRWVIVYFLEAIWLPGKARNNMWC